MHSLAAAARHALDDGRALAGELTDDLLHRAAGRRADARRAAKEANIDAMDQTRQQALSPRPEGRRG